MALHHRLGNLIASAALACTLAATSPALAGDRTLDGEITRITKKRTSILVDLAGDVALEAGAKVKLVVEGKTRTGTVTKVTDNGRAFIKLNKGLPKAVDVGDTVKMDLESGEVADESTKEGAVRLSKGGFKKTYWDEVSYLGAHRRAGTRADVEVGYLTGAGADKSKGGTPNEDAEFAVTDKRMSFDATAGFVGRGGLGGGAQVRYDKTDRVATADIDTKETGTNDHDEFNQKRTVVELKPYLAYLDRPTTSDVGFGVGLAVPIRTTTAETDVTIADVEGESEPAKTTETGLSVDALVGTNSWAFILGVTPGLSGKIKQSGMDDADRHWRQYSFHVEKYRSTHNGRLGVTQTTAENDYDGTKLKESVTRFSVALDVGVKGFNLGPFVDHSTVKRSVTGRSYKGKETDLGARFALAGKTAPFVSLGLNLKSDEEPRTDGRKVERATSGVRIAGGVSI